MNKLYINAERNGYDEKQTGNTMTLGEMIDLLNGIVECEGIYYDTPIYLCHNDYMCTYGSINSYDFYVGNKWDESESIDNLM